jgi:hypothetical protein
MSADDFWNLAGRAGRWGKEFQGNIFCVDADRSDLWEGGSPPRRRSGVTIKRATDDVIANPDRFYEYLTEDDHLAASLKNPDLQYVFSYLTSNYFKYGTLLQCPYLEWQQDDVLAQLDDALSEVLQKIELPEIILERNAGISPLLLQALLDRFRRDPEKPIERLVIADPASDDAVASFTAAFSRISASISHSLGFTSKQAFVRALLVTKWMRGFPLARLIADRIRYFSKGDQAISTARVIREVMKDVEEIARYEAPKLLTCYNDVLRYHAEVSKRNDLLEKIQDLSVFLELGVNQRTQISLLSLGLSRTAAISISEIINNDEFDESRCIAWLEENPWNSQDLPALVVREINEVIRSYRSRHPVRAA